MTREELRRVFEVLALRGNQLVVHAVLSSFGHIDGGERTLCEMLIDAVGPNGTLVIPTFTYAETVCDTPPSRSLPAGEGRARATAYHPDLPVSADVGGIAEAFRHLPGVLRSNHPSHSFAAWGRHAREVLSTQRDNNPLGPLKKLNVMQGQVLLLGTTLQAAIAIHLAEEQCGVPYLGRKTALRINAGGYEERVVVENFPGCSGAFSRLDSQLDPAKVRSVALPRGTARKISVRYLVQLASRVLASDPRVFICQEPECVSCAGKRHALGLRAREGTVGV